MLRTSGQYSGGGDHPWELARVRLGMTQARFCALCGISVKRYQVHVARRGYLGRDEIAKIVDAIATLEENRRSEEQE